MKNFCTFFAIFLCSGYFAQTYSGGTGTSGDPFQIATKADLKYLSEHSDNWDYDFIQTADIVFVAADFQSGGDFYNGGSGIIPVGNNTTANFTGSYNGQNHSIENLYINRPSEDYVGLFGYFNQNNLSNLGVVNATITGNDYTGGLVGYGMYCNIINCHFSGTVNGRGGVGGIAGSLYFTSSVDHSYNEGNIYGDSDVGGLLGSCSTTLTECYNTGNISGTGNAIGGLIGFGQQAFTDVTNCYNCYSLGTVNGLNQIGGLIGALEKGFIQKCYATGAVVGTSNLGGLIGEMTDGAAGTFNCDGSFYDSQTSGQNDSGKGLAKSTAEMKTQSTFTNASWDFSTTPVWKMDGGCYGYPIFNGENSSVLVGPAIVSTTDDSRCWAGTLNLEATASYGQLKWYSSSSGGLSVYTGGTFSTPSIATTTPYWVEATENRCKSARTQVIATVEACSKIVDAQCGTTINSTATKVYCNNVTALSGTTNYRFRIVSAAGTQYFTSTNRWFTFDDITFTYGTPYTIDVQVDRNGGTNFGLYGASCVVNSPNAKLETTQCGTNMSVSSNIYTYDVPGATSYRFMVKDGLITQYFTTPNRWFRLNQINYKFNTAYTISVAVDKGSGFGVYGPACVINSPQVNLVASQCNTKINSKNTQILSNSITGATTYRFKIDNGVTPIYLDKSVRYFTLNDFAYTLNTTYSVSVAVQMNGTGPFSPYGNICTIHTPSTSALMTDESIDIVDGDMMLDFHIETYPNPNDGNFTITSTHEGTFNLVNELGQLIQTIEIRKEHNNQVNIEGLQNGVYFVTGTINNETITKKVVVTK